MTDITVRLLYDRDDCTLEGNDLLALEKAERKEAAYTITALREQIKAKDELLEKAGRRLGISLSGCTCTPCQEIREVRAALQSIKGENNG